MEVVQVDGEDISPTDVRKEKGWLEVRAKCKERKTLVGGADPAAQTVDTLANEDTYVRRAARNMRRLNMTIKKPNLPLDDIKVIVRPRDGFSTATHRAARIGDSIRDAAGLRQEETRDSDIDPTFAPTQRVKDAEAVAAMIHRKTINVNPDVDFAARTTPLETENARPSTGLPCIVKKRQWERRQREEETGKDQRPYEERGNDCSVLEGERRGRSTSRTRSRSHSRSRSKNAKRQPALGAGALGQTQVPEQAYHLCRHNNDARCRNRR
ncbi:hypothetical protein MTO96_032476 [Rhipicephalus appendiculatus]